jgi:hypothetical protein
MDMKGLTSLYNDGDFLYQTNLITSHSRLNELDKKRTKKLWLIYVFIL